MARPAGDIVVGVKGDISHLQESLKQGANEVGNFSNRAAGMGAKLLPAFRALALAGAGAVTGVMAGAKVAISAVDELNKRAARLGVTAEAMQRLTFAARSVGVEAGAVEGSLETFIELMGELEGGSEEAADKLAALGLKLEDLAGKGVEEQFAVISDQIQQLPTYAQQASAAIALFGEEGIGMAAVLRDGADAFRDTLAAADEFGAVISNDTAKAASEFQSEISALADAIKSQMQEALVNLGPIIIAASEAVLFLARAINSVVGPITSAVGHVVDFVAGQDDLDAAIDDVVDAMGDEIRQTQNLSRLMANGITMSNETAKAKLAEAKARQANAQAAIAEAQAIAQAAHANLSMEVSTLKSSMAPMGTSENVPAWQRDAVEERDRAAAERLASTTTRLQALQREMAKLAEHGENAAQNVERLSTAIDNAGGGNVTLEPTVEPIAADRDKDDRGGGKKGGGRGGKGQTLAERLGITEEDVEAMRERFYTVREAIKEEHEKELEELKRARDAKLITMEEYNKLEAQLMQAHARELRQIEMSRHSQALGAAATLFEGLAQVSGKGGEKLLRISKAISAAQAWVDALAGASKALKLPYPQNMVAAAQIVAKGAAFVGAIRGVNSSGGGVGRVGGGGGGAANAGTIAEQPQVVRRELDVNLAGPGSNWVSGAIRDIIAGINEELGDGANVTVNVG